MLALPMMMIRQPETATRRALFSGLTPGAGTFWRGYVDGQGGGLTPLDIYVVNGVGRIIVLAQNTANLDPVIQIQHSGGWQAGDIYGLANVTRGILLGAPVGSRAVSPTVREWTWVDDLGLRTAETHTILVFGKGVGW